jgi:hypothetical protein
MDPVLSQFSSNEIKINAFRLSSENPLSYIFLHNYYAGS